MSGVKACRIGITIMLIFLIGTVPACGGPWRDTYFKKGINRLTQDQIVERMGPPHTAKTPVLGGDTVWTYRVPMSDKDLDPWSPTLLADASQSVNALMGKPGEGPKVTLYCYRYTLVFNEEKVLKGWKREECVPGARDNHAGQ